MIDPARPDFTDTPASAGRATLAYAPADPHAPPCVTIVTPFRNTGTVFHETAVSVFRQSLQQWEWLIVNDGSDDRDSLDMLEGYRGRDPRIRVIDLPRGGVSVARNTGFAQARADYVFQLDSDDLLEPTALEKCWWFLESYPEFGFVRGYNIGFGAQRYLSTHGFHDGTQFLERNTAAITALVRRSLHAHVGGYDETNPHGLEDWEFWLACANSGAWGATIPEYLDWYRRSSDHAVRWSNWDEGRSQSAFVHRLRQKFPALWEKGGFPVVVPGHHGPNAPISDRTPAENRLTKSAPRVLMILPWLTMGGADKFNLDVAEQLKNAGWEVTIATTLSGDHSWQPLFTRCTPDVFVLHHFLRLTDYPRFLKYLLHSRRPDLVLISNSELGYMLLPYLRANAPDATFVDFAHMEEEYWKSGGYPAMAVTHQGCLDLNITSSDHLRSWMIRRGGDPDRIVACHTGVPIPERSGIDAARQRVRESLGISPETPVILYAGRLCDQKQPSVFAETMRRLAASAANWAAVVAGSGPDAGMLQGFVRSHHLSDRVKLLGAVPPDQMHDLMAACDIFFLPSKWEGIAFAVFEAMANGRTVVTADVGGQRELVTPDCGVLVDATTDHESQVNAYVNALLPLLQDAERRHTLGARCRARIEERYGLEHMMTRLRAAFLAADEFRRSSPRGQVPDGVARACASYAIENTRLQQLAEGLWLQKNAGQAMAVVAAERTPTWRAMVLRFCSRLEPAYAWGMQRGWTWLMPLRHRLRGWVMGSERMKVVSAEP